MDYKITKFFNKHKTIEDRIMELKQENLKLKKEIIGLKKTIDFLTIKVKPEHMEIDCEAKSNKEEDSDIQSDGGSSNDNDEMSSIHKKQKFTLKEKYKVILDFDSRPNTMETAKKHGITKSTLRGWLNQRKEIINAIINKEGDKFRLPGAGRKPISEEVDEYLIEWFKEQRKKFLQVTVFRLMVIGRTVFKDIDMSFSRGWATKFLARNKLSLRKKLEACL